MANCGVMRIEKRGRGAVHGLQIEANRTQEDHERGRDFDRSDIDWNETQNNIHLVKTENWNREITRQIHDAGLKERKNSTVMLDGLYTASPAWFEQHTQEEAIDYFRACLDFHVREYCAGDSSRIINAVIHLDEATPHMQVASVPIYEDEKGYHLAAKNLLGCRQDFRLHQDHFFEQVTQERGLERGEVRDWAGIKAHTTKREFQLATQEQALEQARRETRAERAKTQEVIDRRQASIEHANRQKLEALRERDAARAGRDVTKALSDAQERVLSPVSVEVDILAEREVKRSFTGKETPATVTIPRDDLERLQEQATVNEQTRRAARSMTESLRGMREAAADANENRIDKQAAADAAAVSREGQRAQELERELSWTRQELTQEKRKTAQLSKQLTQERGKGQDMQELQRLFPSTFEQMEDRRRARRMEYALDHTKLDTWGNSYAEFEGKDVKISWLLKEYGKECDRIGVERREDLAEWSERLTHSRGISR
ncbi:MAG: plasmid recombination protein [Ruminiclostridium sp.]|nr:plasmid recombination protein [Ruminiclostridium sp.]